MNLYREEILDRYKNPQNIGEIKNATNSASVVNTICGDKLKVDVTIRNGNIEDIKYKSIGCMVSTVSADILADFIKIRSVEEVLKIKEEEVLKLLGLNLTPSRKKCALLCYDALLKALK
jgi:nitrogen fixation NifU-like protein